MGIFSIFGSKPSQKDIDNQTKKAKEQYAQPDYRRAAMEKLLEWNSKESIKALLGRFSVVVQSPHWDEEEKNWLVNQLVDKGEVAQKVLIEHLEQSNDVSHVILALEKTLTKEQLNKSLLHALAKRSPDDHKSSQAKMELIAALVNMGAVDFIDKIVPYLNDYSDDVKCTAIDSVVLIKNEAYYKKLVPLLGDENNSARVLRHAAKAVANLAVDLPADFHLLEIVAEDYKVKNNRLVKNSEK